MYQRIYPTEISWLKLSLQDQTNPFVVCMCHSFCVTQGLDKWKQVMSISSIAKLRLFPLLRWRNSIYIVILH